MQNIITAEDAVLLDALSTPLKALLVKQAKALKNLTVQCVLTSKDNKQLTDETAQYWGVIINHCETLEMFFMTDENVKAIA